MKMLWCWRCKTEMPMLDDDEVGQVMSLLPNATTRVKTCEDHQAMLLRCLRSTHELLDFVRQTPTPCSTILSHCTGHPVGTVAGH